MGRSSDHHEKQYKPHSKKKTYLFHRHNLDLVNLYVGHENRNETTVLWAESKERRNQHEYCCFFFLTQMLHAFSYMQNLNLNTHGIGIGIGNI